MWTAITAAASCTVNDALPICKGLEAIAVNDSPHAKSLHMLYEIVRYRRYGSPFGTI